MDISIDLYFTQCKHDFPIGNNLRLVCEVQYFVTIYSNEKYFVYGQFLDIERENLKDKFTGTISLEINKSTADLLLNSVLHKIFRIKASCNSNKLPTSKSNSEFCESVIERINKNTKKK